MLFNILLHHYIVKLLNLILPILIFPLLLNINQILDIKTILFAIHRTLPPWILAIGILAHITLPLL